MIGCDVDDCGCCNFTPVSDAAAKPLDAETLKGWADHQFCIHHGEDTPTDHVRNSYCVTVGDLARALLAANEEIERLRKLPDFPFDAEAAGEDFATLSDECAQLSDRNKGLEAALQLNARTAAREQDAAEAKLTAQTERIATLEAVVVSLLDQYAYENHRGDLWSGGLSVLKDAFAVLGLPEPCPSDTLAALASTGKREGE